MTDFLAMIKLRSTVAISYDFAEPRLTTQKKPCLYAERRYYVTADKAKANVPTTTGVYIDLPIGSYTITLQNGCKIPVKVENKSKLFMNIFSDKEILINSHKMHRLL